MAKTYSTVVGVVLFLVGILGFALGSKPRFGLRFNHVHNLIHLLTGILGLVAGFASGGNGARVFAQVFGVGYILVAIAGFADVPASIVTMPNLNLQYNRVHAAVGLLGGSPAPSLPQLEAWCTNVGPRCRRLFEPVGGRRPARGLKRARGWRGAGQKGATPQAAVEIP